MVVLWSTRSAASQLDAALTAGAADVADVADGDTVLSLQAEASRLRAKATTNGGRAASMAVISGARGWESMPGSIPAFFPAAEIASGLLCSKQALHTIVFPRPRLF